MVTAPPQYNGTDWLLMILAAALFIAGMFVCDDKE